MDKTIRETEFEQSVKNTFNLYNSLFLSLPFQNISNVGILIPVLKQECRHGLETGKDPLKILDTFFKRHTRLATEEEKINFMFRVIQYVERQIVLYDSVEDAAFAKLLPLGNHLSLKNCVQLAEDERCVPRLMETLSHFSIRIVFTAHPTQFYPRSVLDIMGDLRPLIAENKIKEIDVSLQQLGMTSLMNPDKPTPIDEAKNIIYFLRSVYYDAVGELYSYIKNSTPCKCLDNPDLIQLGFWPGGDRDGNPFVTSETTQEVADELRMTLMKCYYHEIKGLARKLTFREIAERLAGLKARLYVSMFDSSKIVPIAEILGPLYDIRTLLIEKFNAFHIHELDAFIDKVRIFRTHFATLDIRQNHIEHKDIVEKVLRNEKRIDTHLDELSRDDLISILLRDEIHAHAGQFNDETDRDLIRTFSQIKSIQDKNGEDGCNRYIISHAEDIFSVLFVFALLRWCSWKKGNIPVDIIPLFESMDSMKHARSIMQELFELPQYMAHLQYRGNVQTIMLGFSDGTKDGGYLQANWSIFKAKEDISALSKQYGVNVIFFDGRGGPPARGGGKAHRFYASQSNNIANHAIQLTIQGQTITSLFGTRAHFLHNCEQLITAGLSPSLHEKRIGITEQSRQIIEKLAQLSHGKYTELKKHKMFLAYLENKSTLKYYDKVNIGSRPAKRGGKIKFEFDDLRAIPFVGSWSQLRQNVPGYFGIGTALKVLSDEAGIDSLRTLYEDVPFFRTLILNSMMSMQKCLFELTSYLSDDDEYKEFWSILFNEYQLSKQMALLVSDSNFLMETEPVSRRSIKIREDIVLPLLIIQQYAFQKIDHRSELMKTYEKIIERAMCGNINASRNSA